MTSIANQILVIFFFNYLITPLCKDVRSVASDHAYSDLTLKTSLISEGEENLCALSSVTQKDS